MALSIERIHAANLVNFGILPLFLQSRQDLERLAEGCRIAVTHVREQLQTGNTVRVDVTDTAGHSFVLVCRHELSAQGLQEVLAGGRLNVR